MKRRTAKLLLLGLLTFSIGLIGYQLPGGLSFAQQQQQQEDEYSCPMHPDVKSKKPGSCPKCGMTLQKHSAAEEAAITQAANATTSHFPNVELITQDGKKVHIYDDLIKGKTVAIELMYTSCKYNCPLETARLVQVQKLLGDRMGKDIFFYSITIQPEIDTPEVLKQYAAKYHVGPGWLFLNGKEADIKLLSRRLGLDSLPNANDPDGHTPSLLIGNEATGIWMKNSALDNLKFTALKIEQLMGYGSPIAAIASNQTEAVKLNIDKGQYLYATRCADWHTDGGGDKVGPDLLGVANVRDRAWLCRIITEPDKLIDEKDPIATALFEKYKQVRMARLGLPDADVNTLIEFMKLQSVSVRDREKAGTQN